MSAIVQSRPTGAGAAAYVHAQTTPAATWTVNHNLGLKPLPVAISVDPSDEQCYADVSFPDVNTVVITMPNALTGRATVG